MEGFRINWKAIITGMDDMGAITDYHKRVLQYGMIPVDLLEYLSKMVKERIAATRVGDEFASEAVQSLTSKVSNAVDKEISLALMAEFCPF